jgi:hypothetical protein
VSGISDVLTYSFGQEWILFRICSELHKDVTSDIEQKQQIHRIDYPLRRVDKIIYKKGKLGTLENLP